MRNVNPQKVSKRRKAKARKVAKKPRTLNAVWADARCFVDDGDNRVIELYADTELSHEKALRLSQWLAEAAAWKGEE